MNKNKISIYFAFIAILSFFTFFVSVVQKSYFNLVDPIKKVESNKLLNPIIPKLNLEVIDIIESRPENNEPGLINFSLDEISTASGKKTVNNDI